MEVFESEFEIPQSNLMNINRHVYSNMNYNCEPIRFVVTENNNGAYKCEVGIVNTTIGSMSIFHFYRKKYRQQNTFNVVLLIPTGIGADIGGHAGDGNPVAKLLATSCDTLITHPNVVNASEINELPDNGLYVEGSILTRMLMGQIGLGRVRSNKILVLVDKHKEEAINNMVTNAVSAARATLGVECDIFLLEQTATGSIAFSSSGRAAGHINKLENILNVIEANKDKYDAFALSTIIDVPMNFYKDYFEYNKIDVNPWGGYEAMLTHSIAKLLNVPCAHAPMMNKTQIKYFEYGIVDPRKAPEVLSTTWLYCIIKGLHKSPQIVDRDDGINVDDISCLVIPDNCIGLPTLACVENGIPIIAVRENKNIMKNDLSKLSFKKGGLVEVNTYLEAVGVLQAMRNGISLESVQRPIEKTRIISKIWDQF